VDDHRDCPRLLELRSLLAKELKILQHRQGMKPDFGDVSAVRVWTLGQVVSNRVGTRIVTRADVRRAKWKKPKRRKSLKT
jgi:hypothetical protein